jgi:hypothetical protein
LSKPQAGVDQIESYVNTHTMASVDYRAVLHVYLIVSRQGISAIYYASANGHT